MKARIIKSGKYVNGKLAEIFVKCGVAEYLDEESLNETDNAPKELLGDDVKKVVIKRKTTKKRGRKKKK